MHLSSSEKLKIAISPAALRLMFERFCVFSQLTEMDALCIADEGDVACACDCVCVHACMFSIVFSLHFIPVASAGCQQIFQIIKVGLHHDHFGANVDWGYF